MRSYAAKIFITFYYSFFLYVESFLYILVFDWVEANYFVLRNQNDDNHKTIFFIKIDNAPHFRVRMR